MQGYVMPYKASQKPYEHDVPKGFHGASFIITVYEKGARKEAKTARAAKAEAKKLGLAGSDAQGTAVAQKQAKRGRKKKSSSSEGTSGSA
jgi:hypothetical protein